MIIMIKVLMRVFVGLLTIPMGWVLYMYMGDDELDGYGLQMTIFLGLAFFLVVLRLAFYRFRAMEKESNPIITFETDEKMISHSSFVVGILWLILLVYGVYFFFTVPREIFDLTIFIFVFFIALHYVITGNHRLIFK